MSFSQSVQLPNWTQVNALFSPDAVSLLHNQAQTAAQDFQDRATLRGLAPGLATADPNAMATASTLGPQGTAAVTSVDSTQQARMRQQAYGAGLGTQVASSIAAMPDEDSAAAAYPTLRQRAIDQGMPASMLPDQFPGRAGMLAIRNTAVPIATAVDLYAHRPYVDGQDPGPLGIPGVGGSQGGYVHPASGQQVPAGQSLLVGETPQSVDAGTQQLVGQTAAANGLNPDWAMRIHYVEHGRQPTPFGPGSTGASGEIGPMQLMPGTAAGLKNPDGTPIDPHDLDQNIYGGVAYLKQLKDQFGSPVLATAAYNAGPGAVQDFLAGKRGLPDRTIQYVGRVFGADGVGLLNAALTGAHGHAIPGYAGASTAARQPVQVASASNTAGMPQTATDTTAGMAPASPAYVSSLLSGYRQAGFGAPDTQVSLPDPGADAARNAPVPGQGVTAQQAVQQATQELSGKLAGMGPDAANAAVQQRALEILGQGSKQAPGASPTVAPRPVMPGSSVMTTQPFEDTQFPPPAAGGMPSAGPQPTGPQAAPSGLSSLYTPSAASSPVAPTSSLLRSVLPPAANPLQQPVSAQAPQQAPASSGLRMRLVDGKPLPVEGQPGFVQGMDQAGRIVAMQLPGAVNTGRLAQRPNPNGGVDMIAPSGQVIAPAVPNSRDVQIADYNRDAKGINEIADAGQAAQTTQIRLQQMRELLSKIDTGPNGTSRAQLAALAQQYLPDQAAAYVKGTVGMSDPAAAQELAKYALRGAGDQERGVLGARGGYQATRLFQAMNPGLDLLPDANRAILNSQLIGAQADADYAAGALQHFNQHGGAFRNNQGGAYVPLTEFDQQWQSQRNPQVYAGAMGAIAGLPASDGQVGGRQVRGWATGLSDSEYRRALDIVSRADPNAQVQSRSGTVLSMQPANARGVSQQRGASATPAVGTVQDGYRFMGGDPGSRASWQAAQ